ncbi:MAG: hypothetical protein M0Z87_02675 [Actinomycetota bacterium]|nr:hypothetical protein [Actinomycetota bacterium]
MERTSDTDVADGNGSEDGRTVTNPMSSTTKDDVGAGQVAPGQAGDQSVAEDG